LTAPHASWGAQLHVLPDGLEAPLWATVLVVDDGETRAAWVDFDIVLVTFEENAAILKAVAEQVQIPEENIHLTLTHNHAGPPPTLWNWTKQGQDELDAWSAGLGAYAAGAARAAMFDLKPATVLVGSGKSRVAVNRRETAPDGRPVTGCNFDGVIDPEVFVVRIDGTDGTPIAAAVGYTAHPTTMGPLYRYVSPDWPGHLRRTVESLTGATCLFAQGCCGNVGPGPIGFGEDVAGMRNVGKRIGLEAARVWLELEVEAAGYRHERIWESGAPLAKWVADPPARPEPKVRSIARRLDLPVQEQPPQAETQAAVDAAQKRLDDLKAAGGPPAEIEAATFVVKRANMANTKSEFFGGKETYPVDLHVLQIGPAVLVGVAAEPFVEIALEVKERSPLPHLWYGGYVGPTIAYIPTAEAFPHRGYEVDTTPFAPEAAAKLVEDSLAVLSELT
jgi:hypothetical protein